jgi:hypothetical protein
VKRNLFAVALALLLAAGVLSGCEEDLLAPGADPSSAIQITVGTPYNGSIAAFGIQFLKFNATSTSHTGTLSNIATDFSWALCASSACTSAALICDNDQVGNGAETCQMNPLSSGATYYLRIDEWDSVAGNYTMSLVTP